MTVVCVMLWFESTIQCISEGDKTIGRKYGITDVMYHTTYTCTRIHHHELNCLIIRQDVGSGCCHVSDLFYIISL
jgi:hypothetical protein